MLKKRLTELRSKSNLTQEDVAKKIGVARGTYSNYESGKREPDFTTLEKIADCFEVSTDYLLGRTDDKNSNAHYTATLSEKDERDIAKRMKKIRKDLIEGNADGDGLSFMGEPMSEEAVESLLEALEHAERIATLANKKYIPKKYRKE